MIGNRRAHCFKARPTRWLALPAALLSLALLSFPPGVADAGSGCGATPCLTPSQAQAETLFAKLEQQYPAYFSPAAATQFATIAGEEAYYRNYANRYAAGLGTYQGGLWYASGGNWNRFSSLDEANLQFCGGACWASSDAAAGLTILLGSPTASSIQANIFATDLAGSASLEYGTRTGSYDFRTAPAALTAGVPLTISLQGLSPDTGYFYRLIVKPTGNSAPVVSAEHRFHTARPAGSTFTFTIQADSHLDENSVLAQYLSTLGNVLTDMPDFHVDLGDTFMCEKHSEPLSATSPPAPDQATVVARYRYERTQFGTLSHSVPLFLVNGNHEGEAGWFANGTAQNMAVWTTQARQQYFANPVPDSFYSGDVTEEPFVGKRASWYAWEWGDALFVVLDPFWNSKTQASRDPWALTLGSRQYQWLAATLASSRATFKFVFIHNLVGGLDGQMRGGIEAAPYFEWGGRNLDGTNEFAAKRPGWTMPIHSLLVQHAVTAVFHGHDHLYAKQELDGIVYQEVPQPSARNNSSGGTLAKEYHYAAGIILSSSGHIRVTVEPGKVTARYVRAWLPANENAQRKNGQIDDIWSVLAPGRN